MSILSNIGTKIGTELKTQNNKITVLEKIKPVISCSISDHNIDDVYAGDGVAKLIINNKDIVQGNISLISDRINIQQSGTYHIYAQQLNIVNDPQYMCINVNNSIIKYGYSRDNSTHHDLIASCNIALSVGDYVQIYYQKSSTNRWTSAHSCLNIHLI